MQHVVHHYGRIRYGTDESGKHFAYIGFLEEINPTIHVDSQVSPVDAVLKLADKMAGQLSAINRVIRDDESIQTTQRYYGDV